MKGIKTDHGLVTLREYDGLQKVVNKELMTKALEFDPDKSLLIALIEWQYPIGSTFVIGDMDVKNDAMMDAFKGGPFEGSAIHYKYAGMIGGYGVEFSIDHPDAGGFIRVVVFDVTNEIVRYETDFGAA